jgi:surface protein
MTLCIHMPAMGPSSVRTMLLRGSAAIFFFSVFSAVLRGNLLLVSAAVRQAPSSGPYYVAPNGVTVMCPGVAVGDTFDINGVTFTKVDLPTLKSLVSRKSDWSQLATSCTTGITSMYQLLQWKKKLNVDISSWDTSSVTNMNTCSLYVFLHPACCCCSCIAVSSSSSAVPSLRDRHSLHTAARPSLLCRVPMPSISPSLIGT